MRFEQGMTYTVEPSTLWGGDHCTVTVRNGAGEVLDIYHGNSLLDEVRAAADKASLDFWQAAYRDCLNNTSATDNSEFVNVT